jgi:polysaccharide export outer membrane protein
MQMQGLIVGIVTGALAFGTAQSPVATPQTAPSQRQYSSPDYIVGPQDILMITVYGEADISRRYSVDSDGTIDFPWIGRVPANGMTLRQIEDVLVKRLAGGYLVSPQVSVEVAEFRSHSVFIAGEVRAPGAYPIKGNMTIVEALALAGPTQNASNEVIIVRSKENRDRSGPALPGDRSVETTRVNIKDLQSGKVSQNVQLRDGDTIFVPKAEVFFVTGQVRSPGSFVYDGGITVLQAIALAGGVNERGSTRGIKILRIVGGRQQTIDARSSDSVRPGDTIVVRKRFF